MNSLKNDLKTVQDAIAALENKKPVSSSGSLKFKEVLDEAKQVID